MRSRAESSSMGLKSSVTYSMYAGKRVSAFANARNTLILGMDLNASAIAWGAVVGSTNVMRAALGTREIIVRSLLVVSDFSPRRLERLHRFRPTASEGT